MGHNFHTNKTCPLCLKCQMTDPEINLFLHCGHSRCSVSKWVLSSGVIAVAAVRGQSFGPGWHSLSLAGSTGAWIRRTACRTVCRTEHPRNTPEHPGRLSNNQQHTLQTDLLK